MKSSFFKAGHLPTLISCFLYFDLSFMVWVLLGPLAPTGLRPNFLHKLMANGVDLPSSAWLGHA